MTEIQRWVNFILLTNKDSNKFQVFQQGLFVCQRSCDLFCCFKQKKNMKLRQEQNLR